MPPRPSASLRGTASRGLDHFIRFAKKYRTQDQEVIDRDFLIALRGVEAIRETYHLAAVEIEDGFHDSSRRPGNPNPDHLPHLTVRPITSDGRPANYRIHMYEDGSSSQWPVRRRVVAPKKKSSCVIL